MNYFKKNLKYLIKRYDTTQAQLAFQLNKAQNTISNWMNENSSPSLDDLVEIHRIFGISIDALALMDLENSNLITDKHITKVKENGNVNGIVIGNPSPLKPYSNAAQNQQLTAVSEPDPVSIWAIMGQLKNMDEKIDLLIIERKKAPKKGAK